MEPPRAAGRIRMKKIEDLKAYEVIEKRQIDDIGSMSWLLRHKKTGARIALLSNDDENKVFYIGFRTPPTDSTGVPHIIEHTVLCGSKVSGCGFLSQHIQGKENFPAGGMAL